MRVTFLGTATSSGIPMIGCDCPVCTSPNPKDKRLRSAVWVEIDNQSIVIDVGPDFRQQALTHGIQRLDAVLLTHGHRDHTAGLDEIRGYNFKQKAPIPFYCDQITEHMLKEQFSYVFAPNPYPGIPQVDLNLVENDPFSVNGTEVIPIKVMHHKLPVTCYRIADFTYITDANAITDEELEKCKGSKVMVINGLRHQKHLSHFTLSEALEVIEKVQPELAFITHISHQLGLHHEVNKTLPPNVQLAFDGLVLEL